MTKDDREEFQRFQASCILDLGRDQKLFDASKNLVVDLNKYSYPYLWNWFGLPIIQLPADVMATQEAIWQSKPDVVIETGVARGGSLIFIATLLQALGRGIVIGVDIDIRAHNRQSIEAHPMAGRVKLVEGPSTDELTLRRVSSLIPEGSKVMVILDSDHSHDHVLAECRAYGKLVSLGGFLIVADTLVGHLSDEQVPTDRSKIWKKGNDPLAAIKTFLSETDEFEPDLCINPKLVMSSSPGGYLVRRKMTREIAGNE